ncbi:MAG: DEAD/DEAH box helicase [Chitinophagaceae bacterium]|jgi:ATP-dependent RNA helicase RhlE|nr:DEAD/DEAH box helicase [Chitinophagaceae bacterium]
MNTNFQTLGLIEPLLKAIQEEGYTTPTPIQAESIPIVLQGKDLLGCAQTGTGKTAAFTLPILQLLVKNKTGERRKKIRSLIVTPTRELAIQIGESFNAYGRHTGLNCTVIFGGVGQGPQVTALRNGVDVVIATPGRLLDLMNQGHLNIREVEIFVLDEADRMLDMGFVHDVKKLLALLPKKRQSLFFSATMPPEIVSLANSILFHPLKVSVTPVSSTVDIIEQSVYFVDKVNKNALLIEILKNTAIKTALVFTRTKHGADKVVNLLLKNNIKAEAIHGNKAQNARQRALTNFKAQTTRVLVATDIAARGIDVDELAYVVNYEIPNIPETYVHRIGRTGRAGANGTAISFCDAEERAFLKDIEKLIAKKIPIIENHPFPMTNFNPIKEAKQQGRGNSGHARSKATANGGQKRHFSRPKPSR